MNEGEKKCLQNISVCGWLRVNEDEQFRNVMRYVWFFVHTSVSFDLRIFRCATIIITFYWNSCFQSTWICCFLLLFSLLGGGCVRVCRLVLQWCWLLVCGCHKSNVNRREVNTVHSEKAFKHCVIRCQSDCIDTAGNSNHIYMASKSAKATHL